MAADFFLDVIRDFIEADFLERSRTAEVLVGEWSSPEKYPGDVVILGLGDFEGEAIGADAHHYGPGEVDQGDGSSARAMGADLQRVIVWVAARPPLDASDRSLARAARGATQALKHATINAIRRWHTGAFRWGAGKWLNEARGSRIYGGAARFEIFLPLAIWDDANELCTADATAGTSELVLDDVEIVAVPPGWTDP